MTTTQPLAPRVGTLVKGDSNKNKRKAFYGASKSALYVGTDRAVFLSYGLPADLRGAQVDAATLQGIPAGASVQLHAASGAYSGLTWNTQPGTLAGSTAHVADADGVVDVTADLAAYAAGGAYFGWSITKAGAVVRFSGWQTPGAPKLTISYSLKPAPPSGLWPAGGVLEAAAPVVRFAPDAGLTGFLVQVDEYGGDFSTPLFDSGFVASSTPQLDLAAAGWAGVALGVSWQWRVWQRNPRGDSDWSVPAVVGRVAKPSLSWVTAPTATADPTPLHEWAVTGTQAQWAFAVLDTVTGRELTGAAGWHPGADDGYTPPVGPTRGGQTVRSVLSVLDRNDRLDGPATLTKDWTLDLTAAGAAVSSLVIYADGEAGKVSAQWTWPTGTAGVPDQWQIGSGEDILEVLDGSDGRVGTSDMWQWSSWRLQPNTDLDLWVAQVTNGVAGTRTVYPVRVPVTGIWVVDEVTEDCVVIAGTDGLGLAYSDTGTVLAMLDGSEQVITTGMGGYAGDVSGLLVDRDTVTAAEQKAAWLRIKSGGRICRVIFDDANIPAKLTDMTIVTEPALAMPDRRVYQVAAHLSQRGELPFTFAADAPR